MINILIGIFIFFASLWGGSYSLVTYSKTWAVFPIFITMVVMMFGGAYLVIYNCLEVADEYRFRIR